MLSCDFCEMFKNSFLTDYLQMAASNFLPFIQLIWATQFFLVLQVCSHSICIHCMCDVFPKNQIKFQVMMQFQNIFSMIAKIKTTRHTSELQ